LYDSNSLTPLGPSSKQNRLVLFFLIDLIEFCKSLVNNDLCALFMSENRESDKVG